jgi:2-keto-4-pentenoate hydratase/2-oxohepta-3-ene-1,7-dioic acid hydratase in catechol pathway
MLSLIERGPEGLALAAAAAQGTAGWRALDDVTLLAPIPRPRQNVVCVGLNYVAHAIESDRARGREPKLPSVPVFFTKAVTSVAFPFSDFVLDPAVTSELDYEVELAFVIGRTGKNISRVDALSYVFGYCVANDISARDLQGRHQQFFKGKSLDGACPLGPWIVTADEIPDPSALTVRLRVNGEQRQESSVSDLIFDVPTLIEYLSLGMTLEAGTIICTGTPSGVGLGFTPPKYLSAGDVVEAEIDGIGSLRTHIVAV